MVRQPFVHILVTALLASSAPALAAESAKKPAAKGAATAGNTQFLLFGMQPGGSYDVRQNGSLDRSVGASPTAGAIDLDDSFASGDQYNFTLTGIDPVTPATPAAVTANGSATGCATIFWDAPAPADYVTDYVLLWNRGGAVFTDSVAVSLTDVVQNGSRWSTTRCGLMDGTYTFALRAHNSFDLWSGLSNTATTPVTNDNTVGPPPPTTVAATENPVGCLRVTWKKVGDPTVIGYRMYFATRPRAQGAYTDSVNVSGAGTEVASRCGLAAGTYYAAVRSITGTGVKSAFSSEVSVTLLGPDVTAPAISDRDPANLATDVPTNAGIYFVVTDSRSGINRNSIRVLVNGVAQSIDPPVPVLNGYGVPVTPGTLPASSVVTVSVTVDDGATPANTLNTSWSFTTGANPNNDVTPPLCTATTPVAGATGVSVNTVVEVNVADTGLGVALGSVRLIINGASVAFTVTGTPANVRLTHRPARSFAAGSVVSVRMEGCDRASPANCAQPFEYSFTTGGVLASATQGDIVPNGYWAGDPAKPLEVRNLPRAWEVHIFDAAGFVVRRYDNDNSDGLDWSWDFTNDGGQRVAPALYLVRVTDSSGTLQRTGRFLVQSSR